MGIKGREVVSGWFLSNQPPTLNYLLIFPVRFTKQREEIGWKVSFFDLYISITILG
jgi:hypothetical protein